MSKNTSFIVDTNIFLRFLTNDIEKQAKRVEKRFLEAEKGTIELRILLITVVEILFHLERWYKYPKIKAIEMVENLFGREWMMVDEKDVLFSALGEYKKTTIDFVDLLTFYQAKMDERMILSFDKDYDKLSPSLRVEP